VCFEVHDCCSQVEAQGQGCQHVKHHREHTVKRHNMQRGGGELICVQVAVRKPFDLSPVV
jgi:hypothetical protein